MCNDDESIPDRSRPKLPTTASRVAQQSTYVNYDTAGLRENKKRKRGGRQVKKNEGTVERKTHSHKDSYLKYKNND